MRQTRGREAGVADLRLCNRIRLSVCWRIGRHLLAAIRVHAVVIHGTLFRHTQPLRTHHKLVGVELDSSITAVEGLEILRRCQGKVGLRRIHAGHDRYRSCGKIASNRILGERPSLEYQTIFLVFVVVFSPSSSLDCESTYDEA
jgi:hypothetical protein